MPTKHAHTRHPNDKDRRGLARPALITKGGIPASALPEDTATFRVIRDGKVYHMTDRPAGSQYQNSHIYARCEGSLMLTAIHGHTHVSVVSLKSQIPTMAETNNKKLLETLRQAAYIQGTERSGTVVLTFTEQALTDCVISLIAQNQGVKII